MVAPSPTGCSLIEDPLLNKGTAFTEEERAKLGMEPYQHFAATD